MGYPHAEYPSEAVLDEGDRVAFERACSDNEVQAGFSDSMTTRRAKSLPPRRGCPRLASSPKCPDTLVLGMEV